MAEHSLEEVVAITCDGYGYGSDGKAWGGEILFCTINSKNFSRLGHLEPQPLLGGDLASRYPTRLAAAMLKQAGQNPERWLMQNSKKLPHGEIEATLILNQLEKSIGAVETTSCGRVLDAVAVILGICFERSYEGEPAMKMESTALLGNDVLQLEPQIVKGILNTSSIIREVYTNSGKFSAADLAYSTHAYLAKGLAEIAIQSANSKGTNNVGFSGGAACNQILTKTIRKAVQKAGLQFFVHESLPAGDGGVSFGQAVVAGFSDF
jgi:hydrogenase maturation protein HypF